MNTNNKKNLPQKSNSDLFSDTLTNIFAVLTGIAESEKGELIGKIGHVLQYFRSGKVISGLKEEWENLKEKGKIAEDYAQTTQNLNCLHEMLDFLENEIPDEVRIEVLKKIWFTAATEQYSDRNSYLPHEYMQIAKNLKPGEVLVLLSTYEISKSDHWRNDRYGATKWLNEVSSKSKLEFPELVERHEEGLVEKHLLTDRVYSDRSGIRMTDNFRLTSLGVEICKYIENYENIND